MMTLRERINYQSSVVMRGLYEEYRKAEEEWKQLLYQLERVEKAVYVVNTQAPLHYEAPKPPIIVVDIAPKTTVPNAVHVNWSRGHSGAAYEVLAHGEKEGKRYYVVNISTDANKAFPKCVWANDCKAAAAKAEIVVAEKAA